MAKKARENMELATIEEETKLNALYTQIELEDENIGGIDNSSISKLIEFKQKVASAITDMGIETLETANADTMANNIRNISTNKDASSISYDNTSSGLSSTNVQGAVDELNNSLSNNSWKFVGRTTGNTSISLPSEWKELRAVIRYGYSGAQHGDSTLSLVFTAMREEMEIAFEYSNINFMKYMTSIAGNNNGYCDAKVTFDSFNLNQFYYNGTNIVSTAIVELYYK